MLAYSPPPPPPAHTPNPNSKAYRVTTLKMQLYHLTDIYNISITHKTFPRYDKY